MGNVEFIEWDELVILHTEQMKLHGGQDGFVDEGAVRSAVARPQMTCQYDPEADLADLAADYLYGLCTTQGFLDGNKRTALVVAERFLNKNGWETILTPQLMYIVVMTVAKSELDREGLAQILRDHMARLPTSR
jgi:death-on-curing protein